MVSQRDNYGIAVRSLWYRDSIACYRNAKGLKWWFQDGFFVPPTPFRRFSSAGMRKIDNTILSAFFGISAASMSVASAKLLHDFGSPHVFRGY